MAASYSSNSNARSNHIEKSLLLPNYANLGLKGKSLASLLKNLHKPIHVREEIEQQRNFKVRKERIRKKQSQIWRYRERCGGYGVPTFDNFYDL